MMYVNCQEHSQQMDFFHHSIGNYRQLLNIAAGRRGGGGRGDNEEDGS